MGSKGGNTTTSEFKPPAEFMKAYKEALGMARTATSQPYQQYSGNLVAGLTPSQQQGIANVNAAQGMALPAIQQGMQYTQQAAQGITPELYNRFYSPYVKDVADTTFANLMESQAQQQSGLKSGAIQAGAFGGDRSGIAQAEMARQQQLANAMSMSNIYNQGYGQAMGLAGQQVANMGAMGQQLAGLGAGAQASVLQGAQAQMAAGAQEQATEQARLQAAYDQWMQRQAYPYQQAQFFANIAQGLGAGAGGTSSTTAPAPNVFSQIFGGLGAVGSIFSDERMKENIKAVGKLNDGQTIYRYNFKGDPKTQIGLLAQEVESHKPGAVTQVKGLKMVDYADATEDAASMGGVVGPSQYRQGLAEGGIPYHPYGDARAYVPEGKVGGASSTIPKPPDAYEDKGLAQDWKEIMPLSEDQIGGLRKLASDVGIDLPEKGSLANLFKRDKGVGPTEAEMAWISRTNPDAGLFHSTLASGGVVGRHRYADGGSMMDQAIDEAEGLGAAPEYAPPAGLIRAESGGNFGARNAQGYVGRLQFGEARLTDAKRAGVIPAEMTAEEFRLSPEAQKATEAWHFSDINNFIDKTGLAGVEGKAIKGVPVTREGMVNVAHLGGKGGLEKFVASGGRYDPADANGTRLSDYLAMAAKSGGVSDAGPIPSSAGSDGLGGAQEDPPEFVIPGQKPSTGLKLNTGKIFAGEENPSIIERIMGRRLSPEARAAVMNASFALMAGRSPFFMTNLGEAGKVGTQTYYNALAQKAGIAEKQAGIYKTQAETASAMQGMRQKLLGLYYMAKSTFEQDPANDGKTFAPFEAWAAENGFPNIGVASPVISPDQGEAPVNINQTPVTDTQPEATPSPTQPSKTEEPQEITDDSEPPKTEGGPTVLAKYEGGPNPQNRGTLPYWQDQIVRLQKSRAGADYISPEYAASIDKRIDTARAFMNDIINSDPYKDYTNFNANYEKSRADLIKLAEINSRFKGGRGSEQWADFIGALQTAGLDWAIPDNWQSFPGDYDQVMKAATEMAVRNSASLGGLSKAPGSLMELETKFTPDANLSPSARYSIISRALADLDYKNDVYATWDLGLNFGQHQSKFNNTYDYNDYVKHSQGMLPPPALYEGEIAPGAKKETSVVDEKTVSQAISDLNNRFSTEKIGKEKYLVINGQQIQFIKTSDGWKVVR